MQEILTRIAFVQVATARRICRRLFFSFLGMLALVYAVAEVNAEPFTYQGRIQDRGQPANGVYDFQFRLCDSSNNFLGSPLTNNSVSVSNGLFNITLDFGNNLVDDSPRWVEIGVRTNGFLGPYTILAPRQRVTAAPIAIFAKYAGAAAVATNMADGGGLLTNVPSACLSGIIPLSRLGGITAAQLDPVTWYSATNHSVPVINVKDYGALGNGVHDDTAAIASAWNQFLASGGTLFFPPGMYLDSGTHIQSTFTANEPESRNGRLILGLGSVVWGYIGSSHLLEGQLSFPDIDGIEFRCLNNNATNCIYVTTLWNKWSLKDCYFNGWNNTTVGALVIDDADSVTVSSTSFYQCNIGLGLGYKCNGFKGDIWAGNCGIGVAVGVPTRDQPVYRDSQDVFLNVMTLYSGCSVAVDSYCDVTIKGFHWGITNAIIIGSVPGLSTNYAPPLGVTLAQNYFALSSSYHSAIELHSALYGQLKVERCVFQAADPAVPPFIKSWSSAGDSVAVDWSSTQIGYQRPTFETSTGLQLSDGGLQRRTFYNHALSAHSRRPAQETGPLVDALSSSDRSAGYDIARIGVNWSPGQFDDFWGGLDVRYDRQTDIPIVQVINSDLYVTGGRAASGSPGGQVFVSGTVNATNGFMLGSVKILSGAGSPEGIVAAPIGSLYLRSDGGPTNALYIKGSGTGGIGWIAK